MAWSPIGHELYYQSGDQIMAVSYAVKGDAFVPEKPRAWISKIGGTQWDGAGRQARRGDDAGRFNPSATAGPHRRFSSKLFLDYLKQRVPMTK